MPWIIHMIRIRMTKPPQVASPGYELDWAATGGQAVHSERLALEAYAKAVFIREIFDRRFPSYPRAHNHFDSRTILSWSSRLYTRITTSKIQVIQQVVQVKNSLTALIVPQAVLYCPDTFATCVGLVLPYARSNPLVFFIFIFQKLKVSDADSCVL